MKAQWIQFDEAALPPGARERLGLAALTGLAAIGDLGLLARRYLGLLCSIQCPGSVILRTLEASRELRYAGLPVIGGFHSPMEHECLALLLRGTQPVIWCVARGLVGIPLGPAARQALSAGRLLVISPFAEPVRRTTITQARQRNELVAALASAVWVPHAAPGGKTWATVQAVLARQQVVWTFPVPDNAPLLAAGARPLAQASDLLVSAQ